MKVISNTLKEHWNHWTDPGDYPSGAGSGPLPPGDPYVESVSGNLKVTISPFDIFAAWKAATEIKDLFRQELESRLSCEVKEFSVELNGYGHFVLTVDEVGETVGN